MTAELTRVFSQRLQECLGPERPDKIGVAVSGGSDSTALLHLLDATAPALGISLAAVTVDHGLRPESAAEARAVHRACQAMGLAHDIKRWDHPQLSGNLQAAARNARRRLIADWAGTSGISVVALGHTLDDQAETVLMRLARGSGVDGLAAMAARRSALGVAWIRPMLGLRRADLRADLRARGLSWCEDPSNENTTYLRVRIRKALASLSEIGLSPAGLADTAARFQLARQALELDTFRAAAGLVSVSAAGGVSMPLTDLFSLPEEIRRRLFAHGLMWVSGATYRPRLDSLKRALESVKQGRSTTLTGCLIRCRAGRLHILREYRAVQSLSAPVPRLWDGRWEFSGPPHTPTELYIAALGDNGLAQCPDWRETGLLREELRASPGLWAAERLISAPLAGRAEGWRCRRVPACDDFAPLALTH